MATISSLLADHVTLQVRSVDRLFFQGYVPRLQTQFQVIRFLLDRGFPIPSPAVLGRIGREYVKRGRAVHRRARDSGGALCEGGCQGGHRARAFQGGRARRALRGGDGRDRAGAHVGVAGLARRRPGRPPAFRVPPPVRSSRTTTTGTSGIPIGGPPFLKTTAYAPLLGVAVPQWKRVGQAAGRPAGDRVQAVG